MFVQLNANLAFPTIWKRVFERIRHQLIDDESAGDGGVQVEIELVQVGSKMNAVGANAVVSDVPPGRHTARV